MKKNATLAIPLVLAMLVSACGGGGGGGDSASSTGAATSSNAPAAGPGPAPAPAPGSAPAPAPGPAPAPSPGPAPAPAPGPAPAPAPAPTNIIQAGRFAPFGPMILASNIDRSDTKGLTSAARLTGGGSVVAWAAGTSLLVQQVDADGHVVGTAQTVGAVLMGDIDVTTRLSVVATADGGWLVAWISPDRTVLFRRYDASGAPVTDAMPVDGTAYTQALGIQARALADGGFVVAWVAAEGTGVARAYLRRFSAAGTASTDRLGVSDSVGEQSGVQITPMPDGSFLAAWAQGNPDGTESLLARRLDAALNGAGPEQVVQPAGVQLVNQLHRYSLLGAASLSQGAVLFAWAYYDGPSLQVRWQVLDALGAPTIPSSSPTGVDIPLQRFLDSVQAIPAATGFRIVAESNFSYPRGNDAWTTVLDIGGAGELLGSTETYRTLTTVSPTTGAGCFGPAQPGVAAAGGEDGHYLLAYATCATRDPAPAPFPSANLEVVGR